MRSHFHPYLSMTLLVFALILFWQFSQDEFLRGPDGYYYALQADYWAMTGDVKIPDNSIVHRINGVLTRAGMSVETAIRFWICLSLIILGLLSGLLLKRGNIFLLAGLTAWFLLSPTLLFIAIEFSTMMSMLLIWPMVVYCLTLPKPHNLLAILPALLAVFLHKASIPLSGLICVLVLLENRETLLYRYQTALKVLAIITLVAGMYLLKSDHFQWLDLQRLGSWHNLSPGVMTLIGRESVPLAIKLELLGSIVLLPAAIIYYLKRFSHQRWPVYYAVALISPAWFPFSAGEMLGVGERYAILMPFLVMLSVLMLVPKQSSEVKYRFTNFIPVVCIGLLAVSFWRLSYSHPAHLDPDNRAYANVTQEISQENIPMLITHRGLNFFYKFKTHKEAFPYEPEAHWNKTHIWRLTYKITGDEFSYFLPASCSWESGLIKSVNEKYYFLIREDCWVKFRGAVRENENQDLYDRIWKFWRNPSQSRPGFLYNKHANDRNEQKDEFPAFKQ
ncbi:MAG: hypothetical protein WC236_10235 [Gallionellaceae bacterium]|jgi:hypothetical protein